MEEEDIFKLKCLYKGYIQVTFHIMFTARTKCPNHLILMQPVSWQILSGKQLIG